MSLDGKVALVAGSSRGIGADIARYLGRAGAKVSVAARTEEVKDRRLPGTIHSVTQEITNEGGTALAVLMILRDPESIISAVQKVADEWGRIDIVVNNAAIFVPGDLESVQDRHIELSFAVNLRGPILTMRAAIPHMRASGGGHIINISSRGALFPGPGPYDSSRRPGGDVFYGAQKAAIERFTQGQAMLLQDDNIAVNVLSPGSLRSEGSAAIPWTQRDWHERVDPEVVGPCAVYLALQDARSFTGQLVLRAEFGETWGF